MTYSIEHTNNNLSINDLKEKFPKYNQCSLIDILEFYRLKDPLVKKTTVQWRITRLLELGIIKRIGRGKYSIGKHKMFKPYPTANIKKVYNQLVMEFSNTRYCIWSNEWLKSYLPEMEVQIIL